MKRKSPNLTISLDRKIVDPQIYNRLQNMYRDIYLQDQIYIPGSLQTLFQSFSRSLLDTFFKLILQLRMPLEDLKKLSKETVEYKIFDDHRNKCFENESQVVKELESLCS